MAGAALVGRATECATLDGLLAGARRDRSGVLVARGEAGIGKSVLLEYAAQRAGRGRVLRATGVEWEMELPFAGLHQLCAGLRAGLERLPAQREALSTAFGLSSVGQPDRFLVGLAVLGLLVDAGQEEPLVCVATTCSGSTGPRCRCSRSWPGAWTSNRWSCCSPSVIPGRLEEIAGLPALRIGGLSDEAAREVLASVVATHLDDRCATASSPRRAAIRSRCSSC